MTQLAERTGVVGGVATGLAVTGLGGDVLYIEAVLHRRRTRFAVDRSAG